MNDKYQTVSVRLSWGEYRALQAAGTGGIHLNVRRAAQAAKRLFEGGCERWASKRIT